MEKKYSFNRSQFPLTLAYAITCHASQGITKDRVIIDFSVKDRKHALFSVPFSRAKSLDGVFLSSFKKSYVHCDPLVIEEYKRLETSSQYIFENVYLYENYFFNTYTGLPSTLELKISYLNINGLLHSNHIECLRKDHNLMSSDVLCISETKLRTGVDLDEDITLNEFDIVKRLDHPIGMVIFKRKSIDEFPVVIENNCSYQIMVCDLPCGMICFVYFHPHISSTSRNVLFDIFSYLSSMQNFISIIGDLNMRSDRPIGLKLIEILERLNLCSAFKAVTHDQGGQLDYVLMKIGINYKYVAGTFKNFYSDHKAVFLRIALDENVGTSLNFNTQHHDIETNLDIHVNEQLQVPLQYTETCFSSNMNILTSNVSDYECAVLGQSTDANMASDVASITRFDNSAGNNNCWLNCVVRVLADMIDLLQEELQEYESPNPYVNSFVLYLKENIIKKKGGQLCFDDCEVFVAGQIQFESIKCIASKLIGDPIFNTHLQQDAGEALGRLLETVTQFSFCQYQYIYQYTCRGCSHVSISDVVPAHIIRVAVPHTSEQGLFNVSNAITATLENEVAVDGRNCPECGCNNIFEKMDIITLPEFLIVQQLLFESDGNKLPHNCLPSPEIQISALGERQNYQLQSIIEHIGTHINGHYVCYFIKDQIWYRASDLHINVINDTNLPAQPYISIYMKVHR